MIKRGYYRPRKSITCPKCSGFGVHGSAKRNEYGSISYFYDSVCDYCNGKGVVTKKRAKKHYAGE